MIPFDGWRAVGRAMRWARQQDGVTVERKATKVRVLIHSTDALVVDHTWRRSDGRTVLVMHRSNLDVVDVYAGSDVNDLRMDDRDDATQVLRVLAALDLIPAELAEVHDERFTRCGTCGAMLTWLSGRPGLTDKWAHLDSDAWLEWGPHPSIPLCRCDWLGAGTPEHVRSGLCLPVVTE